MQQWFHDFSGKITEKARNGAIKILKRTFSACRDDEAWKPPYEALYKECTKNLVDSDPLILASKNDIEAYAQVSGYSPDSFWYLFEEHNHHFEENTRYGLELAIKTIKDGVFNQSMIPACQEKCLKTVRDITVQLLMLKWGYYGPAETTAGRYLAYHRAEIGHYFSNSINNLSKI